MLRNIVIAAILLPIAAVAESQQRVPAYVLQLPESVRSILVAETGASRMHRYDRRGDGIKLSHTSYMSIGQNGDGKERAWDRRTPLGIYFANDRLDTSRLHEKYGPLAFPLDYPNAWDRVKERTGSGIWIHGVDRNGGQRPPLDTDGCLALPNAELLDLEQHMQLLTSPVIITRVLREASVADIEALKTQLGDALQRWQESYRDGDWHEYLSLYAEDFEFHGLNKSEWSAYRMSSSSTRPIRDFQIDDILLLADPIEPGLYLSRFRQTIVDQDGGKITTMKRLYWRSDDDGQLRIVVEDNG